MGKSIDVKKFLLHNLVLLGIVVLCVVTAIVEPLFLTQNNFTNILRQFGPLSFVALGMTYVIIGGFLDLSVVGIISLVGVVTLSLIDPLGQVGALLCGLLLGTFLGFLNGVIIFDLKVPAMIATLGTQTIFRGILKLLCNGNSISFFEPDGATFVKLFDTIGNYDIFGVLPVLACIWIVVAVIAFLVLRYTVFGRDLFVIGSGIEVARLSGIKVRKTFYLVYSLAGFVYGIAAIMFAGRILRAMPNTGDGYDMDAIAAAVIGGASLAGGRGAITGTFVGTLLMVVIKNAGKAFQINDYILDVITGALIIFAVAMDMVKSRKKA